MSELAKVDPRELNYYREQQATDNLSGWRDDDMEYIDMGPSIHGDGLGDDLEFEWREPEGWDVGLAQEEEATDRMLGESWQHHGWPGDGSGMDDLADFNQNEANDY